MPDVAPKSKVFKVMKLKERMERAGLNPPLVAGHLEIHPTTVENWLSEVHDPGATNLGKLAGLFACSVDDFYE